MRNSTVCPLLKHGYVTCIIAEVYRNAVVDAYGRLAYCFKDSQISYGHTVLMLVVGKQSGPKLLLLGETCKSSAKVESYGSLRIEDKKQSAYIFYDCLLTTFREKVTECFKSK